MGEYLYARIYKPVNKITPFSNVFDQAMMKLYEAGDNKEKVEEIYREINFVLPSGNVLDLNMKFIERNGKLFRTNDGVPGSPLLPELKLAYKYHFHDFWMAMLKPSELTMNEHNQIFAELTGEELIRRFNELMKQNKLNPKFKESKVFKHFYEEDEYYPAIQKRITKHDFIQINVQHIYGSDEVLYRENAKKSITAQRKRIADEMLVPHWVKVG